MTACPWWRSPAWHRRLPVVRGPRCNCFWASSSKTWTACLPRLLWWRLVPRWCPRTCESTSAWLYKAESAWEPQISRSNRGKEDDNPWEEDLQLAGGLGGVKVHVKVLRLGEFVLVQQLQPNRRSNHAFKNPVTLPRANLAVHAVLTAWQVKRG